jgi:hypothetical protein
MIISGVGKDGWVGVIIERGLEVGGIGQSRNIR